MAAGNPVPEGFALAPLSRATIFVRDQQKALALYRDILGLRIRFDFETDAPLFNKIMGLQGFTFKVKILQSGDSVYGNVGLFEAVGLAGPPPQQALQARTGDVGLVFPTNQLDALAAKITAAGYHVIAPPMVLFARDHMLEQDREMLFRDADGVQVCLMQPGISRA